VGSTAAIVRSMHMKIRKVHSQYFCTPVVHGRTWCRRGAHQQYIVFAVLLGIFDFLRKTASLMFRTDRTISTVRTQLYLSCSKLDPHLYEEHLRGRFFTDGKTIFSLMDSLVSHRASQAGQLIATTFAILEHLSDRQGRLSRF